MFGNRNNLNISTELFFFRATAQLLNCLEYVIMIENAEMIKHCFWNSYDTLQHEPKNESKNVSRTKEM
jgi:hypothetical protein